jgi:ankyrin repeat protein
MNSLNEKNLEITATNLDPISIQRLIDKRNNIDISNFLKKLYISAVKHQQLDIINTLIAAGIDANLKDEAGNTPLIWAARYNHLKIIYTLISAGADVNLRDNSENTALIRAA